MENSSIKKNKDFITMGFDPLFKKMFGDVNYTNKAAAVVAIFLNIPFTEVKDRVEILNNEKLRANKKDKPQEQDVLLHVKIQSGNRFVNLEANINGYNEELINRNTGYIANTYSRQLNKNDGYNILEQVLQINFNNPTTRLKLKGINKPIDTYLLRNKEGIILTEMIKIINIDIDMCYNIWYNEDIKKFTSNEQNIIRLGTLHYVKNDEEFRKCLGEIDMDKEVKEKIQHDMDEYQQDKELAMVYDREKHEEFVRQSKERDLIMFKEELETEKQQVETEKQQVETEKQQVETEKQQVKIEKENLQNKKIELVELLTNLNVSIEKISEVTGLTKKEIKEID